MLRKRATLTSGHSSVSMPSPCRGAAVHSGQSGAQGRPGPRIRRRSTDGAKIAAGQFSSSPKNAHGLNQLQLRRT
eukprot:4805125-Alexandrium_andersonii.AAC.1